MSLWRASRLRDAITGRARGLSILIGTLMLAGAVVAGVLSASAQSASAAVVDADWREVTEDGLQLRAKVTEVAGNANGPLRAGDKVHFHLAVKNVGTQAFTGSFAADVTNMLAAMSDEHLAYADAYRDLPETVQIATQSSPTHYWWNQNFHYPAYRQDGKRVHDSFTVQPGGSHYFNIRFDVSNDYSRSDGLVAASACLDGTRGGTPAHACIDWAEQRVAQQYPDLQVASQTVTKVSGDKNGPVRAGDILEYAVTVRNSGTGDWTAPGGWAVDRRFTFGTDLGDVLDDTVASGTIPGLSGTQVRQGPTALAAGATWQHKFRVQVTNDYARGDQAMHARACFTGDTGNPLAGVDGVIEVCGDYDEQLVAEQYPDVDITSLAVTKTLGDTNGPVRAGDILQYSVTMRNSGLGDWTAPSAWAKDRRFSFSSELGEVLDDAVVVSATGLSGTRVGQGPFVLNAGSSWSYTFRVQVTNDYARGDQTMNARACFTGNTGNPAVGDDGVIEVCGDYPEQTVVEQYPDVEVRQAWVNTSRAGKPIRPLDNLRYEVRLTNPGAGDWRASAGWAVGHPVTVRVPLADVLDDVTNVGTPSAGAKITDGVLEWTGQLLAGGTQTFTFTARAGTGAAPTVTAQQLVTRACAGGNARQAPRGVDHVIEVCDEISAQIGERWRMSSTVFDESGDPLGSGATVRPGAQLTYRLAAESVGGWPVENTSLTWDLSGLVEGAEIGGPVQVLVGGVPVMTLPVVNDRVTLPATTLPAAGGIVLQVPVTVMADLADRDLRTGGTGTATPADVAGGIPAEGCGTAGAPCGTLVRVRAETVAPAQPTVVQPVCEADWTVSAPSVALPADTARIAYVLSGDVEPGETVTVTATAADGVRLTLSSGWVIAADGRSATRVVALADPDCRKPVTPAAPAVTQTVCEADWTVSAPEVVVPSDTVDLSYTLAGTVEAGARVTVTATAAAGARIEPAPGWVVSPDGRTASFEVVLHDVSCVEPPVQVPLGALVIQQASCPADWTVSNPVVTLPADTAEVEYVLTGEVRPGGTITVTAAALGDVELAPTAGWVLAADRKSATYTTTLADPPCARPVAQLEAPVVVQPVCEDDGVASAADLLPSEDTPDVAYSLSGEVGPGGTAVVTATSLGQAVLTGGSGWVVAADGLSATFAVVFDDPSCTRQVVPQPPVVTQPVCEADWSVRDPAVQLPTDTPDIAYTLSGEVTPGARATITATAHGNARLSAAPGWVVAADGRSATYDAVLNDASCVRPPVQMPVDALVIEQPVCLADGTVSMPSVTLPSDTTEVTYALTGEVRPGGTVTVIATAEADAELVATTGWVLAADRKSASYTTTLADPDCDGGGGGDIGGPGDGSDDDDPGGNTDGDPGDGGPGPGDGNNGSDTGPGGPGNGGDADGPGYGGAVGGAGVDGVGGELKPAHTKLVQTGSAPAQLLVAAAVAALAGLVALALASAMGRPRHSGSAH